jgi:hypothetical protein
MNEINHEEKEHGGEGNLTYKGMPIIAIPLLVPESFWFWFSQTNVMIRKENDKIIVKELTKKELNQMKEEEREDERKTN